MEFVLYEQKGQYAIITINREKALNALNSAVLDELDKTLDSVDLDQHPFTASFHKTHSKNAVTAFFT